MNYWHDDELPNGYQDADLAMAELQRQADRETRLARQGICTHGWRNTRDFICLECGRKFASIEEMDRARADALMGGVK